MLALAGLAAVVLAVGGVAVAAGRHVRPDAVRRARPPRRRPARPHGAAAASGSRSWPAPSSRRPANTITITDFQGFQRTIHTTSATTYADGLTATPAAGTRIFAVGTVDSDKTSLKATRVGKLPDRGRGPRLPRAAGSRAGPGRHHDRRRRQRRHPGSGPTPTPSPTA